MMKRRYTKLAHRGQHVAEVEVEVDLIVADDEWSPYLTIEDAHKLDEVREALRRDDVATASRLARVYKLVPIAA